MYQNITRMKRMRPKNNEHLESSKLGDKKIWSVFQMSAQPRILLYDDDVIYCEIMAATAKKKNIHMTVCRTLNELLRKWQSSPDLVLLDCQLDEDLRGPDVARLIENTPVILISESKLPNIKINNNIKGFIRKSIGHKDLLKKALSIASKAKNSSCAS